MKIQMLFIFLTFISFCSITGCQSSAFEKSANHDSFYSLQSTRQVSIMHPDTHKLFTDFEQKAFLKYVNRIRSSYVPQGSAGYVNDLNCDFVTNTLNWTYVNMGDYDSSGDVAIPDITMIAQYYLADTDDGNGDDALEAWIDGDKNGEVGISDITPIAQNYLNTVTGYQILTCQTENGEYSPIGEVIGFGETGLFPKTFTEKLQDGVLQYVAVAPVDGDGNVGMMSNVIELNPFWLIESLDTPGENPFTTSLALDSINYPHIAYFDAANYDLKYLQYNGVSWAVSTVDSEGTVGNGTSLALDSNNNPHISYYDGSNENLKYATFDGVSWITETVDDSLNDVGFYSSLALDAQDNPHISYFDLTTNEVKYAYFNGSSWNLGVVDVAGVGDTFSCLKLDSLDNPRISFTRWDGTYTYLNYAYLSDSVWESETIDGSGDYAGGWTSLSLDTHDNPHISFDDKYSQDLRYAYNDGSIWHIEIVDENGDVGYHSSLVLDSRDNPHICYYSYDAVNLDADLKYAYYNGSSWLVKVVDSEGDVGASPSIAVDSFDRPHISYLDNSDRKIKYARQIYRGT